MKEWRSFTKQGRDGNDEVINEEVGTSCNDITIYYVESKQMGPDNQQKQSKRIFIPIKEQ